MTHTKISRLPRVRDLVRGPIPTSRTLKNETETRIYIRIGIYVELDLGASSFGSLCALPRSIYYRNDAF